MAHDACAGTPDFAGVPPGPMTNCQSFPTDGVPIKAWVRGVLLDEKALLQLQKVEERLKEADIILNERGTGLKELKKDRDHAMKFKEMSDKVKENKASLLKLQMDAKESDAKEIEAAMDKAKEELAKIQEGINGLRKENDERKQSIEALTREVEEKGETGQIHLNKEIESIKVDTAKKQSRLDTIQQELA